MSVSRLRLGWTTPNAEGPNLESHLRSAASGLHAIYPSDSAFWASMSASHYELSRIPAYHVGLTR